jgi:hypothetical protein
MSMLMQSHSARTSGFRFPRWILDKPDDDSWLGCLRPWWLDCFRAVLTYPAARMLALRVIGALAYNPWSFVSVAVKPAGTAAYVLEASDPNESQGPAKRSSAEKQTTSSPMEQTPLGIEPNLMGWTGNTSATVGITWCHRPESFRAPFWLRPTPSREWKKKWHTKTRLRPRKK